MKLILKNALIIDPVQLTETIGDIAVCDGLLVAPAAIADDPETEAIDLTGKAIAPGFIDLHVHLREPGQEHKEDIATGTAAAASGGFTTVVAMPNTIPAIDSMENIALLTERIRKKAKVRVLISACLSRGRDGAELTDIPALAADPNVVALTDDGNCLPDRELMKRAMTAAAAADIVVMDHCEDRAVWNEGIVREGDSADRLGVAGMPPQTESNIVRRNIELCRETGARLHCQHLSCVESVQLLEAALQEGLPVSAEVTPHHLALTDDVTPILGAAAKMNPPLGSEADRNCLLQAVASNLIRVIATDHAPHSPAEKSQCLTDAPFGIIGLETAFLVCKALLVDNGPLRLPELVARFTVNPAAVIQSDLGTLAIGKPADITIFEPDAETTIDIRKTKSKSCNSPFHNLTVKGRICGTIAAGNWAYRNF